MRLTGLSQSLQRYYSFAMNPFGNQSRRADRHPSQRLGSWSPRFLSFGLIGLLSVGIVVAASHLSSLGAAQAQPRNSISYSTVWRSASFPVENFQTYTSPFGYRRSADGGYSMEFHYGLDLAAPMGSYIRNWWTGQVVEVTDNSRCGTSAVIQSGDWEHIYCHMQGRVEVINGERYLVDRDGGIRLKEGQTLVAGARIGRVGMTGRTTGPHLHWGMKFKGDWVDPARVLQAMLTGQPLS